VAFPSSSATLVPGALALLRSRYPGIRVELSEAEPPEALASLHAGRADLAVVFTYDTDDPDDELDQLAVRPLLDDPLSLVLPVGHPSVGTTRLGDLREQTWIAGCHRCRGHLLNLCRAAGFAPQIDYATDDYVAVLGLVAAGLGVAVLPELLLTTAGRPDVHLTPLQPSSVRRIHAVTTPDLQRVPAVAAAINALAEVAAKSSAAN
jgi:DNA-binding transcriptional LysR family regulator